MEIGLHFQQLGPPVIYVEVVINGDTCIFLGFVTTLVLAGVNVLDDSELRFDHSITCYYEVPLET